MTPLSRGDAHRNLTPSNKTMNPDWRNEPATEKQKEQLHFFGCTWDEGITAGQASDALEECAKQFPDVEAAYQTRLATPEQLVETPPQEVTIQEGGTSAIAQPVRREGFFFGTTEQNVSPQEYTIPARAVQAFAQRQISQEQATTINSSFAGQRVSDLLKDCPLSDGCYWLPVAKAANLTFITTETKITIGRCRLIADKIEAAGYCVEPDARFGSVPYEWNQTLGLFKPLAGDSAKPTAAYVGAANLLRLCVLIAAADGQVDQKELDIFRQVIENQLGLTQTDHQRLLALERLLTEDPSAAGKTLAKVAKSVPAHKRLLIGKVLVRVAAIDRAITKRELRALERVFKAFELPPDTLEKLVQQTCPPSQETEPGASGERVPEQVVTPSPQGFALDLSRVYAITNETKEVVAILSVVMEAEKEETLPLPKIVAVPVPKISQASSNSDAKPEPRRFDGLDAAFCIILERLLTRDSWPQADFNALAREFHFMPLNIHDTLNEWADEVLGDFILDGEDPVVIRRELIAKETI